ncbi:MULTISPECIES: stalk domain-containing protein [Paenibacillus]|uniref:Stalk domain-containing protein n=3 Tax=Paenibacillus TaxID=44249 RepID=A0AAJ2JTT6_9BACL|nr:MULTISPECIES: stalk domain-containing protein [Paenibacillus]EPY10230.1 hypothetical protein PAAL66ix_23830 [Paenibacillus alvei A6-6i-x]MCY9531023.1 copper amine oxidase N-terminal domain-containing protein [Paenibacillus alvei]MDT8976915.1 stalk domain-containing protein [Paenibacillus sp. chi10]TQR45656.1 hypothetical protein C7Y44_07950 [Paenibacillus sp. SDF0028]SDF04643.1 Copper amine oxidase N-terminal domain-containing protein [Paenibacillus sp. cl6col]
MKCRRLAAFVLLGSIVGGAYASAQTDVAPSSAQAAPVAEKIDVVLNGNAVNEGGYMIDGRAYLSVRQIQEALQAFIFWDDANKKVVIDKPNVDLLLFKDNKTFGKVETGKTSFTVFVQVDSLQSTVDAIKITITDPKGKTTELQESSVPTNEDNFWFRTNEHKYDFKAKGDYMISCYLRQKNGEFTLISQKKLPAISKL